MIWHGADGSITELRIADSPGRLADRAPETVMSDPCVSGLPYTSAERDGDRAAQSRMLSRNLARRRAAPHVRVPPFDLAAWRRAKLACSQGDDVDDKDSAAV